MKGMKEECRIGYRRVLPYSLAMQTDSDQRPARRNKLTIDLGEVLGAWRTACAQQGMTVTEGTRQAVRSALKQASGGPASVREGGPVATEQVGLGASRTERVEIRLTASEYELAGSVAAADGFTLPRWIAKLVRYRLTGTPQLGQAELAALSESNYQLHRLGRNLNQIARMLNIDPASRDAEELALIKEVRATIERHTKVVGKVLDNNFQRWALEPKVVRGTHQRRDPDTQS